MSTIKSSNEHLTLNADGSSKDIKFQANGVEKASISSAGVMTATSFAGSGAALTGVGVAGITSSADATAITIDSSENVGVGTTPKTTSSTYTNLQVGGTGAVLGYKTQVSGSDFILGNNVYYNSGFKRMYNEQASMVEQLSGKINFKVSGAAAADSAITWTNALEIANDGNVGIGISPKIISGGSKYLTVGTQTAGQAGFLELVGNRTANSGQDLAIMKFVNNTTEIAEIGAYDNGSTNGGDLKFKTTVGGTSNVRLTIKGDGRVVSQSNAHSWVNYDQTSPAVQDSYNVSSVTDVSAGYFQVNFDVNHGNASYAVSGMAGNHRRVTQDGAGLNAGYVAIYTQLGGSTTPTDESRVFVITFGDSA